MIHTNGIDMYCEVSGSGPAIILIPDGSNDCEPYDNLAQRLAGEFQVITFDMRGGTRSPDPDPKPVTPQILTEDIVGIINYFNLKEVTLYGCSSGGITALTIGKYYPELVRNVIVHEAALQTKTPIKDTGYRFFETVNQFKPDCINQVKPSDIWGTTDKTSLFSLSKGYFQRREQNSGFWHKWYLKSIDSEPFTAEQLKKIPNLQFTVGTWSPAWLAFANIEAASESNRPYKWFECSHHPEITCPDDYALFIAETTRQYL